jgi:hypothetical protein
VDPADGQAEGYAVTKYVHTLSDEPKPKAWRRCLQLRPRWPKRAEHKRLRPCLQMAQLALTRTAEEAEVDKLQEEQFIQLSQDDSQLPRRPRQAPAAGPATSYSAPACAASSGRRV